MQEDLQHEFVNVNAVILLQLKALLYAVEILNPVDVKNILDYRNNKQSKIRVQFKSEINMEN